MRFGYTLGRGWTTFRLDALTKERSGPEGRLKGDQVVDSGSFNDSKRSSWRIDSALMKNVRIVRLSSRVPAVRSRLLNEPSTSSSYSFTGFCGCGWNRCLNPVNLLRRIHHSYCWRCRLHGLKRGTSFLICRSYSALPFEFNSPQALSVNLDTSDKVDNVVMSHDDRCAHSHQNR